MHGRRRRGRGREADSSEACCGHDARRRDARPETSPRARGAYRARAPVGHPSFGCLVYLTLARGLSCLRAATVTCFPAPICNGHRAGVLFKYFKSYSTGLSHRSYQTSRLTLGSEAHLRSPVAVVFVQGYPEHKVTNRPSVTGHTRTAFSSSAGTQYTLDPAANRRLMFVRVLCAPRLASKRTRGRPRRS